MSQFTCSPSGVTNGVPVHGQCSVTRPASEAHNTQFCLLKFPSTCFSYFYSPSPCPYCPHSDLLAHRTVHKFQQVFSTCLPHVPATSHTRLLSFWNTAGYEGTGFYILVSSCLNSKTDTPVTRKFLSIFGATYICKCYGIYVSIRYSW